MFAVELDLTVTKDGHVVCTHDAVAGRAVRGDHNGRPIRSLTLQQLHTMHAGEHPQGESHIRVPTMEEAIITALQHNLKIFLDVKLPRGDAEAASILVDAIAEQYRKHPQMYNSCVVCSFYPTVLWRMRQVDRYVPLGQTYFDGILTFAGFSPYLKGGEAPYLQGGERQSFGSWVAERIAWAADWALARAVYSGFLPLNILDVDVMLMHKRAGGLGNAGRLLEQMDLDKWDRLDLPVVVWTVEQGEEIERMQQLSVLFMID